MRTTDFVRWGLSLQRARPASTPPGDKPIDPARARARARKYCRLCTKGSHER